VKTLWVDTASNFLYVGLTEVTLVYSCQKIGQNNHSELLLETIKEGMKSLNWRPKDLQRIVVGIGPGSYTGLRVSLTVAKMLAWTLNIPLYTISSLDFAVSSYCKQNKSYLVLLQAKRNYHYMKTISFKNQKVASSSPEVFLEDEEIKKYSLENPHLIVIKEDAFSYNPSLVDSNLLTKVDDIFLLEPNYLRGVL